MFWGHGPSYWTALREVPVRGCPGIEPVIIDDIV